MSDNRSADRLGSPIARILRDGTLVAVAVVAVGYIVGLIAAGDGPGTIPMLDLLGDGGPDALIGAGLLVLTLLPVGVLAAAVIGFARLGERSNMVTSLLTLTLLIGSLVAAVVISAPA